ncbi:hypothetical protein B0H14DRAFT_2991015 [Mycena olivaceomarginata]|nr:hypothetical protein B0H14DRAFT_2991015 [Mycena olivaceomarginata]
MPGPGAFASTPATGRVGHAMDSFPSRSDDPSWSASLESPLTRLDRGVQNFPAKTVPQVPNCLLCTSMSYRTMSTLLCDHNRIKAKASSPCSKMSSAIHFTL